MIKRKVFLAVGLVLLVVFITNSVRAGQVVTDAHRNWAKVALAQEKALEALGAPDTMAVLYFINKCGRPELDPVQKGIAYMLITDLSKVEGLHLVERVKLQALLEEIGLGSSGLVAPDSFPRVGSLLGATHIVSGRFYSCGLEKIGIDPGILAVPEGEVSDLPDTRGILEEIFRMEKDILFGILEYLKKVPTEAVAVAELHKPMTTSLTALLFLFKGMDESDQGHYELAAKFYRRALKADPNLAPATDFLAELRTLGLIAKKKDSRSFLRSLRNRTSLTDRLSPDQAVRRVRTPREVAQRQSLRPPKPDDVDDDRDGFTENQGDCDDSDPGIYPGATETCGDGIDQDCNGSDALCPGDTDDDGDGVTERQGDCNDGDASVYPGAAEVCGDGIDQDCNGSDAVCPDDVDNDGDGVTENQGDCNDGDAGIYPGASEVCGDGIDQDCNGVDDPCTPEIDNDGDGYTVDQGDCNDANSSIHPGARELCDGIDNDCDGMLGSTEVDRDGDGYMVCSGDCNDASAGVHPGSAEVCDGIDTNCDGVLGANEVDADGDGYMVCAGDCNDASASVHPGSAEACDGIDSNCDGLGAAEADRDGDGYMACAGDCNDTAAAVYPGGTEICDGLDNDCNGQTDEGLSVDADGDNYYAIGSCLGPATDCNDGDININPGVTSDPCDGIDNNCNGIIDEDGC